MKWPHAASGRIRSPRGLTVAYPVPIFRGLLGNGACISYADAVACLSEQALSRQKVGGFLCPR
jgi:hypothetical protein